jgi:hypothetical protein
MADRQIGLIMLADAEKSSEPVDRAGDDVAAAFERIRAQIVACCGPEPMAAGAA